MMNSLRLALLTSLLAGTAVMAELPVEGRWDLTIGNPPNTFPSWISIQEKDGKVNAWFVGRAGSVNDLGTIKVEGNKATWKAGHTYEGTVDGSEMKGTMSDDKGNKTPFTGKRYVPEINVTGKWVIQPASDGKFNEQTLTLVQNGSQISGTLGSSDNAQKINNAKLKDGVLSFTIKGGEGEAEYNAKVKGDVLEAEVTPPDGEKDQFVARRQREWGEPIKLFNGKDMTGWVTLDGKPTDSPGSHWKVIDGLMANTASGANIMTEQKFGDFKLHVEFNVPERGNSGVYLRGRYEVQVEDSYGKPPAAHGCGAIYSRITPRENASKKGGEWQTYDITLIGNYVTVVHNGKTIIDNREVKGITGGALDSNESEPGPIYLQGDHSAVKYRDITLTPAKPIVAPTLQARQ